MTQVQQERALDQTDQQRKQRINFSDGNREAHLKVLYAWLHPDLRELPGIDWTKMPSRVISYLVLTIKDAPHAPHLALAAGTMVGSATGNYIFTALVNGHGLLRTMPQICCETWSGLNLTRKVWEEYITKTEKTNVRRHRLLAYSALTEIYAHEYIEHLPPDLQVKLAPYLLPRISARFVEQHAGTRELTEEGKKRRKERSDILVPLHAILVALVQFRKQSAQRLRDAFRQACAQAEAGEALPISFSYEDSIANVNPDARTVADIRIEKRTVLLEFKLWNRSSWVLYHLDDFGSKPQYQAKVQMGSYTPEKNHYFVQHLGASSDLLWFGDLLTQGMLQSLQTHRYKQRKSPLNEQEQLRLVHAEELGVPNGYAVERPGVLTPAKSFGGWLLRCTQMAQTVLFEPESLYRGVLFGAALTTLALTNGSRVNELLQVSADRFKGHPYEERKNGQLTGKQQVLWLQYLLPKGKFTEAERQFFPISPQAYELLREIGTTLKEHYGCIPTVFPHRAHKKLDQLDAERYLFQWSASSNGRLGALSPSDVNILIRFLLHGLAFHTKQGELFSVSVHLLRHVMATAARHEHGVPAEAVAYVLHHQQQGFDIPIATQYYSQRTEAQQLSDLAEFLTDVEEQTSSIILSMPNERTLAQMDEDLRDVFERWHTLLETAFGFCGRVGLCPRGYNRCLCIGCPHLIPNPAKRQEAVRWRMAYAQQAKALENDGVRTDARQMRLQVQELDDIINSMDILQQSLEDGTHRPVFLQLPSAVYDEVVIDAEA